MTTIQKRLAKKMRALRGERTLREFSKKTGVDHSALRRIEQGSENITLRTLQRLCDRLKCRVGYLFGEED